MTTELSPAQLMEKLFQNQSLLVAKDRTFFLSVNDQFKRKGSISEKQLFWMKKLFNEFVAPAPEREKLEREQPPKLSLLEKYSFPRLYSLIQAGRDSGLKFPSITIPGKAKLSVYFSEKYLTTNVSLERYRLFSLDSLGNPKMPNALGWKFPPEKEKEILEQLLSFDMNPEAVAKIHGQETGHCCFCNRELTTRESLSAGYGPICADNFGLPWGKVGTGKDRSPENLDLDLLV